MEPFTAISGFLSPAFGLRHRKLLVEDPSRSNFCRLRGPTLTLEPGNPDVLTVYRGLKSQVHREVTKSTPREASTTLAIDHFGGIPSTWTTFQTLLIPPTPKQILMPSTPSLSN